MTTAVEATTTHHGARRFALSLAGFAAVTIFAAGARGDGKPPAGKPPVAQKGAPHKADDEMKVEGTLGSLEQSQVEAGFKSKQDAINGCYQHVSEHFGYLTGALEIKVRVDERGVPGDVQIVQPLGSYEVEHCVAHETSLISFPAPKGGAAEFNYSVRFNGKPAGLEWSNKDVGATIAANRAQLDRCMVSNAAGGLPKSLRLVFFVTPGGVVKHVGVGADVALSDDFRRCISDRVSGWKFTDPMGKVARVVFQF